ncbi:MAG: hypothetical protein NWR72_05680 [Bacteroidia bacterium]|nr:hypothetical protein [Bacteroidia bacterium]
MKKYHLKATLHSFLLVAVLTIPTMSRAQIADHLVPHFGFMYQFVNLEDPRSASGQNTTFSYYTLSIGSYYELAHKNDVMSVGVDAGVNFGINFIPTQFSGTVVTVITQVPMFAMARVGALSTKYNQQPVGLGLGIGGVYTYFNDVVDFSGNKVKSDFIVPAAVGEVTLRTRGNTITGRVHVSLLPTNALLKGDNRPDLDYNFSNFGLGLIYNL